MNIGIETLRAGLRLTIHRGGTGNRPNRLSASYPVGENEVILSGMVITASRNTEKSRNEWVKGVQSDSVGNVSQANSYYIAVDDSTDGDVLAAGSLQGLSVRGDYEVSTSQFTGSNFQVGQPLTPDGATGKLKLAATPGDVVIAHVVKDYVGPVDLAASFTAYGATATQTAGVTGGVYIRPRETNAQDLQRLRIELVPPYELPA